jgi:2-methylisocitrate lyase-like PEP mutase family enzyme
MPNPWDAGSAVFLASLGFRALATTSSGMAFARAKPDDPRALDVGSVLAHVAEIVAATALPVNADFQAGYADDLPTLAKNVVACVRTGAAGLSIEDATGDGARPLYDRDVAIERVKTARAAVDKSGVPVLLTARCEAFLVGDARAAPTALDRLVAFAAAGADCLFAPGVRDLGVIRELVAAVAPTRASAATVACSTRARSRSPRICVPGSSSSGATSANSSPPQRPTRSVCRTVAASAPATVRSTASPTEWPCVSLMRLKWSTSMSDSAIGRR